MDNSMKVWIKVLKMPCLNKQPFVKSVNIEIGNTTEEEAGAEPDHTCKNLAEIGKRTVLGLEMEIEMKYWGSCE